MAADQHTAPHCECAMRGMTGGKAHPLCPVHGHLHDGPQSPARAATVDRCRPCRTGAHDFCERTFDPSDGACGCNHDPRRA